MGTKNDFLGGEKIGFFTSETLFSIQQYFYEKTEGLNLFEKVMLMLYSLMTLFFLFSAMYLVLTKGFKF